MFRNSLKSKISKKILKAVTALSLTMVMSLTFTACSSGTAKEAPVDASKATRTVDHAMGQTVINGEPKKVVILTNEGTEALLELGVKPVGAVQSWTGKPWYEHIEKEMEGVQNLGTESQVNIEAIAALKPDLIIGNKMRHEKIYTQLSEIAPTVYSDTLRGEWKTNFEFYGKALNKEKEAKEVLSKFDGRVEKIGKTAGDKLQTKVSLVRFMPGKTRIYLGDTFAGTILKQIGFARPEAQQSTEFTLEIGKERIKEADGDVMFYFTYENEKGEGAAREKEWVEDPLFKTLEVSKKNKVFKVDDAIWNTAGGVKAANLMLDDVEKFIKDGTF